MRRLLGPVALLSLVSIVGLVSCGGGDEEGKDALAKSACSAPASGDAVALPSGFPQVTGVTFANSTKAGPTTLTAGSADQELGDVYTAYKSALGQAPYSVTKSEKEDDDAEVNYESSDTTGQVKLRDCGSGKTAVLVTARPK